MALSFLHKDVATDPCKRLLAFTNCRYYDLIDYLLTQEKNLFVAIEQDRCTKRKSADVQEEIW
jgi:hypothetical protein